LIVVEGFGLEDNRKILSNKNVDILVVNEDTPFRDTFHYRAISINHVLCKLAKKNDIAIAFSFSSILNAKDRIKVIGRIMQDIKLCMKYDVDIIFASFARNKFEMRSPHDILSFAKTLGMTPGVAKKSLEHIEKIIEKKKKKFPTKGVEIIEE